MCNNVLLSIGSVGEKWLVLYLKDGSFYGHGFKIEVTLTEQCHFQAQQQQQLQQQQQEARRKASSTKPVPKFNFKSASKKSELGPIL